MNTLSTAFQKNVTIFDSLTGEQLGNLRQMAHDCTTAITAKAERAGMKDMSEMSKDDLILLYWISVMDDTITFPWSGSASPKKLRQQFFGCRAPEPVSQLGAS